MINEALQWFAIVVIGYAFRRYNFANYRDHKSLWHALGTVAACLGYGKQDLEKEFAKSEDDNG